MDSDPMSLKDKYSIVGIGYTAQGQVANRTALSFYLGRINQQRRVIIFQNL